jgi:hypothetical protein
MASYILSVELPFKNHALQLLSVIIGIPGASARRTTFTLFASLATFTPFITPICLIPFGQFILLILGQIIELIKLVVSKGNTDHFFTRVLTVTTKATLGLAVDA